MKKKSTSKSAPARHSLGEGGPDRRSFSEGGFFNFRVLIASMLCLFGVFVALVGSDPFSNLFAQTKGTRHVGSAAQQDAPGTQKPDVLHLVGPVHVESVRNLPYVPSRGEHEERVLTRYPHGTAQPKAQEGYGVAGLAQVQQFLKNLWRPTPTMPGPILTFEGIAAQACGGCRPPDSEGDVGPNHYVEAINAGVAVYDKNGNLLMGPTTYNTLFAPLGTSNACGNNQNGGDPFVMYDQMADRWLISDFASSANSNWQCIAVSETPDPTGSYFLYAVQIDPDNPAQWGDYPKFALWNNPLPGGAYHLTVNLGIGTQFIGVRAFAFDRAAMLTGQPNPTVIAFSILPLGGIGDSYSMVPANFRTGDPPPPGRDEMLIDIDSPFIENIAETLVKGWLYHVDFVTPSNSTIGIGVDHSPNALITVSPFVEAWTEASWVSIVPQQGTSQHLDTLGDRIMTPLVYQNRGGTESLWASHTIIVNFPAGPSAVRWYQFDVTGGTFPVAPVQQQTFDNNGDGIWRFMPSIAVDQSGNAAIGYSVSSPNLLPGIRYAGRLVSDPPNDLSQGEATMFSGTGYQSGTTRWGDYSMTTIDPSDGMTFWHVNEYQAVNGSSNWHTRIGKFNFEGGGASPTPTPTSSPSPTATATASPSCAPPPPDMASWWPGDGNTDDIIDGNNGTLQTCVTFAEGEVGQAFSFDGSRYVEVPDAANLDFGPTAPITIDMWVYRVGSSGVMHFIGKRVGCGSSINYQMGLNTGSGEGLFFGNGLGDEVATGQDLPLNTWTHLAGTFDGSTYQFYINGTLAGTHAGTLGSPNSASLLIGASGTCSGFVGLIDEVELFNRALTQAEIQSIVDAGSAGKCKPEATATPTPNPTCSPLFFENFDSVTPPSLPSDWTATQGVNPNGYPFWFTTNLGAPIPSADSPPNAVYSVDPDNLLDNRLNSVTFTYTTGAQLSFRQNYDLEEEDST